MRWQPNQHESSPQPDERDTYVRITPPVDHVADDAVDSEPDLDEEIHDLRRELSAETRMSLLPLAVATATGGVDLWQHAAMVTAVHGHNVTSVLIHWSVGTGCAVVLTAGATWILADRDALEGLPGQARTASSGPVQRPDPTVKPLILGALGAGGAFTLLGAIPITITASVVVFLAATARWTWRRLQVRRAVRKEWRDALAAAEGRAQLDGPPPLELAPGDPIPAAAAGMSSPTLEMTTLMERWDSGVNQYAPNTKLIDPQRRDDGTMSFIVDRTDDGGVSLSIIARLRNEIAGALHLELPDVDGGGGQDVVFDQPPGLGLHRGQVRMQIIRGLPAIAATSAGARVPEIPVHRPDNPYSVEIGSYIDDHSSAWWTLADHDGAKSGLIIATSTLGKTYLKEQLVLRARQLGFQILYIDPTEASSPVIARNADWRFLGLDECYAGYLLAEELARIRQRWMRWHKLGAITPSTVAPCLSGGDQPDPECPCGGIVPPPVLMIVDECDQVFNAAQPGQPASKMGPLWGVVVKRIRKLMMEMIADSQIPEQGVFGQSEMLRSNSTANFYAGHVASTQNSNLIPGLPYAPVHIPRVPGRGLLCGEGSRNMEITLRWAPRRSQDLPKVGAAGGPFIEDLFATVPRLDVYEPDRLAAARIVPQAASPEAVAESRDMQRAAFVATMTGQIAETAPPSIPAVAPDDAQRAVTAKPAAAELEETPDNLAPDLADLQWPEPVRLAAVPTLDTSQVTAEDVIWGLLQDDATARVPSRKRDLIAKSGYGETTVRNVLNRMIENGRVERTDAGFYRPTKRAA